LADKLVYSIAELADVLSCSLPVAYQMCRREDFPVVKISERRLVVPITALQKWLDDQAAR